MTHAHSVVISNHAWGQFVRRYHGVHGYLPQCALAELHELINHSELENLGHGAVLRILDNDFTPALYRRSGRWRLVFDESGVRLITVEVALLNGSLNRRKKERRRRR